MKKEEKKIIEDIEISMDIFCDSVQGCPYVEDDSVSCRTCQARSLYNANYRKIADDEIVIKKDEYETLKAQNDTLELSVKDLRYRNAQFSEANKLFAKRNDELLDELQGATAIKEKTAREILQEMFDYCKEDVYGQVTVDFNCLETLARKYGIELEG